MTAMMASAVPAVEREATIIQFPRRPWWASAPNPACVEWCDVEHDPNEFATDAALVCWRTIVDDDRFTVRAQSYVGPRDDGTPEALGARDSGPFVDVRIHEPVRRDMAELAAAYAQASAICASPAKAM